LTFLLEIDFLPPNKKVISSHTSTIRYRSELEHAFADLVAHDRRVDGLKLVSAVKPTEARFKFEGRLHRFALQYLLTPTVEDIPAPDKNPALSPLLVVPRLSDAFLDACRKKGVSVADLNGRLYLRRPGLLICLSAISDRDFRFGQEPRNVFVGKSVRIVRSLLSEQERQWRQAELVQRTGVTSGLVSRIVTYLARQGLLRKSAAQQFVVASPLALLDAWAQADDFGRRATTYRFTALNGDPLRYAREVRDALTGSGVDFAFTQWIAAWLRHPYTEPPVVSLYVSHLPSENILEKLGLRAVTDAGRVWFHVPSDEGVFREKRVEKGIPIVADAQIYIDLLKTGLRGPEQAQALREWPGFCRQ
jgi:hypothetical protein